MSRPKMQSSFCVPFSCGSSVRFLRSRDLFMKLVGHTLTRKKRYLVVFVVIVAVMGFLFYRMPTSYLPDEDQGILLAQVMMPTGSTLEQTKKIVDDLHQYFEENEKDTVESCMTISGFGYSGRAQNNGMVFVKLKDWKLRDRADMRVKAIAGRAMGPSRKSAPPWCSHFRRRPSSSWATPGGSIFNCWTGAAWGTEP